MTQPSTSSSFCPVPEEQQPLNEYQELRQSWFFRLALAPFPCLLKPLFWVWLTSWVIAGPVAAASFVPSEDWAKFLLTSGMGAYLPVLLVLIQLYLGWRYVGDRLAKPWVCYEESGWFDGQVWQKPAEISTRDRLIFTYEIRPLLLRLEQLLALGGVFIMGSALSWPFLP
ncbi:MAG: CGLD27 family protein [Prochlorothrix sp.]|nr:CGLD27 family protein [Prochlorothrix sp.]